MSLSRPASNHGEPAAFTLPTPLAHPVKGDAVHERPAHPVHEPTLARARVFAEALFSTESGPPDRARLDWLIEDLRDFLSRAGGNARLVLWACLLACNWLAPLFIRRMPTLADLTPDERALALDRVERTSFGPIALGPKAILCMLWFEHPETQRETRTEPSCLLPVLPSNEGGAR